MHPRACLAPIDAEGCAVAALSETRPDGLGGGLLPARESILCISMMGSFRGQEKKEGEAKPTKTIEGHRAGKY